MSEEETFESLYDSAFDNLNERAGFSLYLDPEVRMANLARASIMERAGAAQPQVRQGEDPSFGPEEKSPRSRKAWVEEVPDEGDGPLEATALDAEWLLEDDGSGGKWKERNEAYRASTRHSEGQGLEPPTAGEIRWVKPRRWKPSGTSAIGVSVLALQGHLNDPTEPMIDLRLDSGADITLLSAEAYASLRNPPKLKKGRKMQLWQLTDQSSDIEGYVELPVYIPCKSGELLAVTAEAYVVPRMNVPILLGEDFHVAYELGVTRHLEFGTTVAFGNTGLEAEARGVRRELIPRMAMNTAHYASYVKAKLHRRNKARRRARKAAARRDAKVAKLSNNVRIPPRTCINVHVECGSEGSGTWLVEKNMTGDDRVVPLVIPNVLIPSQGARIPVSNPGNVARFLRKGEVIASLADPEEFLDGARSQSEREEMSKGASRTALLVRALQAAHDDDGERIFMVDLEGVAREVRAGAKEEGVERDVGDEESWGPKTAEVPDPTIYKSEDIEKLIDVGDVPPDLKPRVWEMLKRRIKAFGFDRRLGHLETKCRIRTKEGVDPVSVPMYGSSPAKRQVINEQIDAWFAQGVIEPSESPWGAPVVIVYRNGKARFCVDYRRLNALTIPDEFPLPRQSEILSALSGAQVLSSLDALSGFTQIEIEDEDVEKTAFRTHRGLFQFRRMPFGLKNGPSIFQRTMQNILAPYLWLFTLVYIDDIVVYSKTYEEHLEHLDKVLEAIEKSGLTLSPKKCHFFYSSILLLGHKVSRLGLSTHEEKVRAITELQ